MFFGIFKDNTKDLRDLLEDTKKLYDSAVKQALNEAAIMVKDIAGLKKEKTDLTDKVENLKLKAKIEEEDIKHMVKMKQERQEVEFEKKIALFEKEKNAAIAVVKDEYRDKMEKQLTKESENIKEMYAQILTRLPDVNVMLGQAAKEKEKK